VGKTEESGPDLIRRVTAATVKAIAERPNIEVTFSAEGSSNAREAVTGKATKSAVRLPSPPRQFTQNDKARFRGDADALALHLRYHDDKLHKQLSPRDSEAAALFDALEQIRVEALGSRRMLGVAQNLSAALEGRLRRDAMEKPHPGPQGKGQEIGEALGLLVREALIKKPLPNGAEKTIAPWRDWLNNRISKSLQKLPEALDDQSAFSKAISEILETLHLMEPPQEDVEDEEPPEDEETDVEEPPPPPDFTNEVESEEGMAADSGNGDDQNENDPSDGVGGTDENAEPTAPPPARPPNADSAPAYHAFSTKHDQEAEAKTLCEPEELERLRNQLDQQLLPLHNVVTQLANRLQRRLMAKQIRSWNFDQEEGLLDSGRLARVIVDPVHPLSFKQETDSDFRDTVVTLLIDNSGSMRGRPITVAALSADILARTLERCSVKVEIIGFTTRSWKGGKAREAWVNEGKPKHPGRLNDLLHVIYKAADTPWRHARKSLGLMLREGLLKENIDGEALLWAHSRLMARPEQRRILMVISDGAPVDDATLSANPGNYLEKHLRDVIGWIETRSSVELCAIGIGHDVTRYYRRAITLIDIDSLGSIMMDSLAPLFDDDPTKFRDRP
jgi:cobaltochelatase CobT